MNKVLLIGRLTKEPELRFTPNGAAVASFTLAVNRRKVEGQDQEADFINIIAWNKQAENCAKYLVKGQQAAVEGRLQIRTYEGNDGQKRWVTEVIAHEVEFLGKPSGNKDEHVPDMSVYAGLGQEVIFNDNEIPF